TAMVSPKWVPRMADAEDVLETLRAELSDGDMGSRVRVLVPNLKGLERAAGYFPHGVGNLLVNVGVTDGFNRHNLNRSVDETLEEIGLVVQAARPRGIRVDASISVAWGCPYDGPVAPERVMAVAERLFEAGVAELSFGDTIGVATPTGVRAVAAEALRRFPGVDVAMHFHDTRGMALANALVALDCGVRAFEGSI